jgi:Fic family protein
MRIDQQLGGLVVADNEQPLTDSQRHRFIISALMDEAIASSQIEGAATTRRVAREMLRRDRRPRTIDERMIVNNYRAIGFIREHRSTPLTPEFVIELQRMLTDGTLKQPDQVGRLRREDEDVVVSDQFDEVLHAPPRASELPRRLAVMCAFANSPSTDDASFMHPVVRAILLHFALAYDHPFCDGNGRTARALFYWSMLRSGYWLVEHLAISRIIRQGPSKYGRAFLYSETDEFDLTYFIVHQLDVIRRARAELQQHLRRKGREAADARKRFKDDAGLNDRQRALLLGLVREPDRSVTIESHQRSHGVVYATARSDLLRLVERGYLAQQRVGNRFEFSAGPLLEALEPEPPTRAAPPATPAPPAPS